MPDSAMLSRAIVGALASEESYINGQLALEGTYKIQSILDYFNPLPDRAMYPLIMLKHVDEKFDWVAMPQLAHIVYQQDIYGLMCGVDPSTLIHSVEKLANAVQTIINQRSNSLFLEDGTQTYCVDKSGAEFMPINGITYVEAVADNGLLSRGFRARVKIAVRASYPDKFAYANSLNTGGPVTP